MQARRQQVALAAAQVVEDGVMARNEEHQLSDVTGEGSR
jgi:hypothetical protein